MQRYLGRSLKAAFIVSGVALANTTDASASYLKCGQYYIYFNEQDNAAVSKYGGNRFPFSAFSLSSLHPRALKAQKIIKPDGGTIGVNTWATPYDYKGLVRSFSWSMRREYPTDKLSPVPVTLQYMDVFSMALSGRRGSCGPG